ncbi:MAG TPA: hypothetical protein VGV59_08670 [Pyrinomonadaceae bacterium]|nr:hypothetical protein [Pyrinomonadaceae bacterium]
MLYVYIIISIMVGSALLALISEAFTYEVSRVFESALERVEYRLALRQARRAELRAQRRMSNSTTAAASGLGYGVSYVPRA